MIVSAIIQQPGGWRSHLPHEYLAWFKQIADLGQRTLLFLDECFDEQSFPDNVVVRRVTYHELPLTQEVKRWRIKLPAWHNPPKDNQEYLVIQNSKTHLVYQAMAQFPNEPQYTWLDAGAPHFMTSPKALEPLTRLRDPGDKVRIPGIQPLGYSIDGIHWRFAGSCFTGRGPAIAAFHEACTRVQYVWLPALTWEINVWGCVEFLDFAPIEWVHGDHNDTLLANL